MKKFMTKVETALSSAKTRIGYCSLIVANGFTTVYAKAGSAGIGGDGSVSDGAKIVETAIDAIVGLFPWIGAFFVVSGALKLIMAYRGDNPEAQTGAAKDLVIGAALIIFRAFIWKALKGLIFGT